MLELYSTLFFWGGGGQKLHGQWIGVGRGYYNNVLNTLSGLKLVG